MSPSHDNIKRLLAQTKALSEDEQEKLLATASLDNPDLKKEALALLHQVQQDHFLDPQEEDFLVKLLGFGKDPDAVPDRIGAYQIISLLGQGGMGRVYLALQDAPVKRLVALKTVKTDRPGVQARFQWEMEALAQLNHPHVATVLDHGCDDQGTAFFTMNYFAGCPITEFAREQKMNSNARIDLFLKVCDGLAHVHQKGLIHRDIKPANILAKLEDRQVSVKILDFGIAKKMGDLPTEATLEAIGSPVGTLIYLSPEQTWGAKAHVDTRSDIYAAGLLLYELLFDEPVINQEKQNNLPLDEILRIIREEDIQIPAKLTPDTAGSSKEKSRIIPKELRWILAKTLIKDPEHRYRTVLELSNDLEAFLNGHPVSVGPQSQVIRLVKTIRRHKLTSSAIFAALLFLLTTLALTTYGNARLRKARNKAQAEAKKATTVLALFEDVLAAPNPYNNDKDIKLADALAEVGRKAGQAFAAYPEAQLQMHHTLAKTYAGLGHMDKADNNYRTALTLAGTRYKADTQEWFALNHDFISFLISNGEYQEAQTKLDEVVPPQQRFRNETPMDIRFAILQAHILRESGKHHEAKDHYEALLGKVAPDSSEHMDILTGLGNTWIRLADWPQAVDVFQKLLRLQRQNFPQPEHFKINRTLNSLAFAESRNNHPEAAIELYSQVLTNRTNTLGIHHTKTIISMYNLGLFHMNYGDLNKSKALLEEAFQQFSWQKGSQHPYTLESGNALGLLLLRIDQPAAAESLLSLQLKLASEALGNTHTTTLSIMQNLSIAQLDQGRFEDAVGAMEKALPLHEAAFGKNHPKTTAAKFALGKSLAYSKSFPEALSYLEQAYEEEKIMRPFNVEAIGLYQSFLGCTQFYAGDKEKGRQALLTGFQLLLESSSRDRQWIRKFAEETKIPLPPDP